MAHRQARQALARIGLPFTVALLGAAAALHGCADEVAEPLRQADVLTAQIGDRCYPPDEANPAFPGFDLNELTIETQINACQSGVCLVNHFQGRLDCPLGQAAPTPCAGHGDTSCGAGTCVASTQVYSPCDPGADGGAPQCGSGTCDPQTSRCTCATDSDCGAGSACDPESQRCAYFVCRNNAGCQVADASAADNAGKMCCADGSGAPVSTAVSGQCALGSPRAAADAVYCSCRCGLADGDPTVGGTFCACPDGFDCTELQAYVGLGDESLSGKYCIKSGTAWTGDLQCGQSQGF